MSSIGSASLTITPKFDNLGKSVTAALNGVDATASGEKIGTTVSAGVAKGTSGLLKSGALMGVFSAATTKAMDLIGNSVGSAVSRLDTLNNYPRVMQTLGYSAEASEASIAKMSDHLTGLPTALNEMTSTVQGISAITGDLDQATNAGLALNDMLLASGSNTALVSAAMEQFRQMLAKGVPEMQDWKSLTIAMPGQMSQLAKSMLGPTATANDLYAALGGGGGEAIISMDEMMAKMVELDTVGGEGITSFADQAKNATGGVETSMANMQTAISRGMADVLDSIGTENIAQATGDLGKTFENGLKLVGDGISAVMPGVKSFCGAVKEIAPSTVPAIAAIGGLAVAYKGVNGAAALATNGVGILSSVKGVASGASEAFLTLATRAKEGGVAQKGLLSISSALGGAMGGPLVAGIGLATVALSLLGVAIFNHVKHQNDMKTATTGLTDAIAASSSPIQSVSGAYDSLTANEKNAGKTAKEVADEVAAGTEAHLKLVDSINTRNADMATSTGLLETYKDTINEYANQSGLTATQQQELSFAIEQVNEQCGTQYSLVDAANGVIQDQNCVVQENTDAINENIAAKQKQIQEEVLSQEYADVYIQQYEDMKTLNDAQDNYNKVQDEYNELLEAAKNGEFGAAEALEGYGYILTDANEKLKEAKGNYDSSTQALDELSEAMVSASTEAGAMSMQMQTMGTDVYNTLNELGINYDDLGEKLADLGVTSSQMTSVTSEDFNKMLQTCGGDIDALAATIEVYNSQPLQDKDGNINVEAASLVDANGMVYTWNDEENALVDKNGEAVVNDVPLVDAQGRVWVWNGTDFVNKTADATVTGNIPSGSAQSALQNTKTATDNIYSKSVDVNVGGNYESAASALSNVRDKIAALFDRNVSVNVNGSANAAGGFRLNAAGGYRFHATGAIATHAMPLDIVGEDGAEAIVPLTNKKYSEPFARTLAEQMGYGRVENNYYSIDGLVINDNPAIQAAFETIIRETNQYNILQGGK